MKTSTYGSELAATRIATELTMELRYKLRIIRVTIDGTYPIPEDNESVATSLSITSIKLKNKNNAIEYHQVR